MKSGYDNQDIPMSQSYCVSDNGEVFRNGKDIPLRPVMSHSKGYLQVSLWEGGIGKTWFVHQIVAITFHGERPSKRHHAAHRDGSKINNSVNNIEWITKEENEADKILHGRSNNGNRNGMSAVSRKNREERNSI